MSVRRRLTLAAGAFALLVVGEAIIRPDVTLGPVLPVSGDGRTSWAEPVTAPAPRE